MTHVPPPPFSICVGTCLCFCVCMYMLVFSEVDHLHSHQECPSPTTKNMLYHLLMKIPVMSKLTMTVALGKISLAPAYICYLPFISGITLLGIFYKSKLGI